MAGFRDVCDNACFMFRVYTTPGQSLTNTPKKGLHLMLRKPFFDE